MMTTPETTTTEETPLRANVDKRFYRRFLLIGVAAIGFALWSLYDGAVAYPRQRVRALAYQKLVEKDHQSQWREYARERGWSTKHPGRPKTEADVMMQYIMAVITGTVGIVFLVVVLRARGKWIEANGSGLSTSWGQQCDFDRIVTLNKKRWPEKGIAKITYVDGRRTRRLVLDNYKYDRYATSEILYALEASIGEDKIVGGPPEPLDEGPFEEAAASPRAEESGDSE